jgi:hypothetical protein
VRSSWSLGASVESHESVHAPIDSFAGVSDGASCTIPKLLIPGGSGREPLDAHGVALLGRARLGERECYELRTTNDHGTTTLWIDCASFLLRRIAEAREYDRPAIQEMLKDTDVQLERDSPGFRSESTTTYEPVMDAPIEPERFAAPAEWPRAGRQPEPPPASIVVVPISDGSPSASEILARVRTVYSDCRSVRNRGSETKVTVRASGERRTDLSSFSLDFMRPDRVRLETVDHEVGPESEWRRALYLVNEDGARSRYPVGHFLRPWAPAELFGALALLHVVPGLLVPCPPDRDPLPMPDSARLAGTSRLAGRECFVVDGTVGRGFERRLWIDCGHYLVRRCEDVFVFDDAWYAKMRAESEERLRNLPLDEDPSELRRTLEHFSKPHEPYRAETTRLFEPELDVEIPLERFATPAEWRGLPVTDRPAPGARAGPPAP